MNKKRMQKVINHLKSDKLGHEEFNFCCINVGEIKGNTFIETKERNECGTVGCALGEFPIIWPNTFAFSYDSIVAIEKILPKDEYSTGDTLASIWLNIPKTHAFCLFYPNHTICGIKLGSSATKEQVINRLELYMNSYPNIKEGILNKVIKDNANIPSNALNVLCEGISLMFKNGERSRRNPTSFCLIMNTITAIICIINGIVPLLYVMKRKELLNKLPSYIIFILLVMLMLNIIGGLLLLTYVN